MSENTASKPPFPADFLNRAGLNRQHVFALADLPPEVRQTLGDIDGYRQLILIGHGGRLLWERVQASGIGGEHPIDDYCVQTVARWFADFLPATHYSILYPGEQPVGLQALGKLAGWHQPSPFMVGIDAEWGSWFAYRAAVLTDSDFLPFFPVDPRASRCFYGRGNPCLSCQDTPCISACPADALHGGRFALDKCIAQRKPEGSPCEYTCLARVACPVGSEHRYDAAQLHHTYAQSLRMIREFY